MTRRQRILPCAFALLVAAVATGMVAAGSEEIGQIFFEIPEAKGELDPVAGPVESGSIVRTLTSAAVVHLDNHEVLKLATNTAVIFDAGAEESVLVTVLSGHVSKVGPSGQLLRGGSGSRFRLEPSLADALEMEAILLGAEEEVDPATGRIRSPGARERAADRAR